MAATVWHFIHTLLVPDLDRSTHIPRPFHPIVIIFVGPTALVGSNTHAWDLRRTSKRGRCSQLPLLVRDQTSGSQWLLAALSFTWFLLCAAAGTVSCCACHCRGCSGDGGWSTKKQHQTIVLSIIVVFVFLNIY